MDIILNSILTFVLSSQIFLVVILNIINEKNPRYKLYSEIVRFIIVLIIILYLSYFKFYEKMTHRNSNLYIELSVNLLSLLLIGYVIYKLYYN